MQFIRVVEKFHSSTNKTASIDRLHEIETDGEFIFQQLYYRTRFIKSVLLSSFRIDLFHVNIINHTIRGTSTKLSY